MTFYYFIFSLFVVLYACLWYVLGWIRKEEIRKYLFYMVLVFFLVFSVLATLWSGQFTFELPLAVGTADPSEMAYYAFILVATISGMTVLLRKLLKYPLDYSMFLSTMTAYGFMELSRVPTYYKTLLLAEGSIQTFVIVGLAALYLCPALIAIVEMAHHNLYALRPFFWFYLVYCLVLILALLYAPLSWLLDIEKGYFLIQWTYVFRILFAGVALGLLQSLRPAAKRPKMILVVILMFLISIPLALLWG